MKQQNRKQTSNTRRQQPRKDSKSKRINEDNARLSKVERDIDEGKAAWMRGARAKDCNDIAWYASNSELLKSAASMPFSTTIGLPIFRENGLTMPAVPGVMAIYWEPFVNGGDRSAIQQAANSIYSYIVHANSRNYNYNAPDLMLMILAGIDVFKMLGVGIRAFGAMQNFEQQNYYTPKALLAAMGFDYDDLRSNLSKMWFDLNELIARSKQVWIPNVMPVLERWFWMSTNVYMDASSVKAQYYLFVPASYYVFEEKTSSTGSSLSANIWAIPTTGSPNLKTWAQYLTIMNTMIDALLNAEDRGIIFGDILNAYGADKLYALNAIAVDYKTVPTYNAEVLTQIENCNCVDCSVQGIQQDANGNLMTVSSQVYTSTLNTYRFKTQAIINFHQTTPPTPEQIMIATRMMALGATVQSVTGSGEDQTVQILPTAAGTEFGKFIEVFTLNWSTGVPVVEAHQMAQEFGFSSSGVAVLDRKFTDWAPFDWAPWLYAMNTNPSVTPTVGMELGKPISKALGDFDNYGEMNIPTLQKMHTTAVYSEFGIPTAL